jgi:hypothetical protein
VTGLLDDGRRVQVPGAAVDPRLRLLRPGQRVRLLLADGAVVALGHPGLPLTGPDAWRSPDGSTMSS